MLDPRDVIVPILGLSADLQAIRFLGTGTFVGDPPLLLTADHVVRDWEEILSIVTMHDVNRWWRAYIIERDIPHDLALLRVHEYRPNRGLSPAFERPVHPNLPLVTFEYGTTIISGEQITLNPATRVGNMTRMLNLTDRLGPAGEAALELSFPALHGASGAPVLANDGTFDVLGVIVANVSYHLLPAEIESVLDEKNNLIEERRFMLPQAVAVTVRHLRPMFERACQNIGT